MKYLFLLHILLLIFNTSFSQKIVLIRGTSELKDLKPIEISRAIRDCIKGWIDIDKIPINSTGKFQKAVNINQPMLIYLKCGEDYVETFVSPGDTINLSIKKLAKEVIDFNGYLGLSRTQKAILEGNRPENNFFTQLEAATDRMDNVPYPMSDYDNLDELQKRDLIKKNYQKRLKHLNEYCLKYPALNPDFKIWATYDIKGKYIEQILNSAHENEKIDTAFLNDITSESFSWQKVSHSQYLFLASYAYYYDYLDNTGGENYTATRFSNKYNNIKNFIYDIQLKEFWLTSLMNKFMDKEPDNYQEILEDYKKTCKNKYYVKSIDSIYHTYLTKEPPPSIQLSDSALAVKLTDLAGKEISLGDKLKQNKESLIFIDFWASWCGPCLMQIPYLKVLENKLGKKIVFISIPQDKNRQSWENAVNENQLTGNQYVIDYLHRKALFKELDLKSIPRFILVKPNGEVINTRLPHPNEIERVSKIIDKVLLNMKKF